MERGGDEVCVVFFNILDGAWMLVEMGNWGGRRAEEGHSPMQVEEKVLSISSGGIESVGVGMVSWIVSGERAWISIVWYLRLES